MLTNPQEDRGLSVPQAVAIAHVTWLLLCGSTVAVLPPSPGAPVPLTALAADRDVPGLRISTGDN